VNRPDTDAQDQLLQIITFGRTHAPLQSSALFDDLVAKCERVPKVFAVLCD
jgi:hypothetical protein